MHPCPPGQQKTREITTFGDYVAFRMMLMKILLKIKHLLQRFVVCCREYSKDRREFGSKVARVKFWDVLIPTGKNKRYIETLSRYMEEELKDLTNGYSAHAASPKKQLDKIPIWVCWWQGEESAPPIVRACLNRMREVLPENSQLHLITWDNLDDYIERPKYILQKYKKGLITNIHMSDILRYGLMSAYGGAWIDSTVWLSDRIRDKLPEYLSRQYFTQRFKSWEDCPKEACRGKWCNFFFMGKADCAVFSYVYDALLLWWQKHDRLIDYVIVDYIIWAGYSGVPAIRQCIDAVEPNNHHIWLMEKHLNDVYTPENYEKLLSQNDFFKLSYKGKLKTETADGSRTVYGHILSEYEK